MCRVNGDAEPPKPIGKIIKRAREKRRWSQQQAADALGVSRSALNKWENDRAYPRSAIGAIEELYGISIDAEQAAAMQRGLLEQVFGDKDARHIRRAALREYGAREGGEFLARIEDRLRQLGHGEGGGHEAP